MLSPEALDAPARQYPQGVFFLPRTLLVGRAGGGKQVQITARFLVLMLGFSLLFSVSLLSGVTAAPFADVPSDHWAYDAVAQLLAKGLVNGYPPDNPSALPSASYGGGRAASRYEMAVVTAGILSRLESLKGQVTGEDLELLRKLVNELRDELDSLGVRLKNAEEAMASMEKKLTEVERIRWAGRFESVFTFTGLDNHFAPATMSLSQRGFDPTYLGRNLRRGVNIYPLEDGATGTSSGYLELLADLGEGFTGGGRVAAFDAVGTLGSPASSSFTSMAWGVPAPYLNNPTLIQTGIIPWAGNNLRVELDGVWVAHEKTGIELAAGAFYPGFPAAYRAPGWLLNQEALSEGEGTGASYRKDERHGTPTYDPHLSGDPYLSSPQTDVPEFMNPYLPVPDTDQTLFRPYIYSGPVNYSYFGPSRLPLYGGRIQGKLRGVIWIPEMRYEGFVSRVSALNLPAFPWENLLMGAAWGVDLLGGKVNVNWLRIQNGSGSLPPGTGDGNSGFIDTIPRPHEVLWDLPYNPAAPAGTTGDPGLGPQREDLVGADLQYEVGQWGLTFYAGVAASRYRPNTNVSFSESGRMFFGRVIGKHFQHLTWSAELFSVDPDYDPFLMLTPGIDGGGRWGSALVNGGWESLPVRPVMESIPGVNGGFSRTPSWSLHDLFLYPHNREGVRLNLNWEIERDGDVAGSIWGSFSSLGQVKSSSPPNIRRPGFLDAEFPGANPLNNLPGGSNTWWSMGGGYRLKELHDLKVDALWMHWETFRRGFDPATGSLDVNHVDTAGDHWNLEISYPWTGKLTVLGGVSNLNERGVKLYDPDADPLRPRNVNLDSTSLYTGAKFQFAKGASAFFLYRLVEQRDHTSIPNAGNTTGAPFNWDGTQALTGVSVQF